MQVIPTRPNRFPAGLAADVNAGQQSRTVFLFQSARRPVSPIQAALQEKGYRVIHAESLDAALTLWAKSITPVDLFLTDVHFKGNTSVERLIQLLRAENPQLRVLFACDIEAGPAAARLFTYPRELMAEVEQALA